MKPEYSTANTQPNPIAWIQGGGKMGELIRTLDWSRTNLGPISEWPMLLRFNVNLLLHSPLPMMVLWGPEGIMLYNDGFSAFAGSCGSSYISRMSSRWGPRSFSRSSPTAMKTTNFYYANPFFEFTP